MPRPQLAEFMRRMEPNSVAILPAAREATRSNDTEYRFRQDSDFYYLTGFNEPDAIAVVTPSRDERYTLFVRPRDREKETWTGRRAGVEGAKEKFGADALRLYVMFVAPPEKEVEWRDDGLVRAITKKPIVAGDVEIERNPRARSAKLRVVEKTSA